MKLSPNQREVLKVLDAYIPLAGSDERGWKNTTLFSPLTVRSLVRRGLVEPSSDISSMLKTNLFDISIKITPLGTATLNMRPVVYTVLGFRR